jgi:CheY-like chemotaxis protein
VRERKGLRADASRRGRAAVAYNILIVDDSETMRKVIRKAVALSGFRIYFNADGQKLELNLLLPRPE